MDMSMSDPALAGLPLSDPRCNSMACDAYAAGTNASQAAVPWATLFEYGHWTTWFYIIVIFLFMLVYAYGIWVDWRSRGLSTSRATPTILDRITALIRSISYRRISGRIGAAMGLPSGGLILLILAAVVFAATATFAARPYYRERDGYGSPPIAIRTGLMAVALTPIIVALAGKFNIISILTGIGHEKLNTMHRYLSWICFVLSIVHTIPFIVAPLKDGGRMQLHMDFYMADSYMYTGVPALALLTVLVSLSLPWIRSRVYEFFAYTHVMAAITYVALMFWHAAQTIDSWAYLWATLAIWLFSIFGRVFYRNSAFSVTGKWFEGFPTTMRYLTDEFMKLEVLVPDHFSWRPGQHCFLRFPKIAPFDNHPFTIASIPQRTDQGTKAVDLNVLTFIVRSHTGFTSRLLRHIKASSDLSVRAFVDGPYGGVSRTLEKTYDSVICVAGGVGITSSIPWILHLSQQMRCNERTVTHQVKLIWAVKRREQLHYVEEELTRALQGSVEGSVTYEFYITAEADGRPVWTSPANSTDEIQTLEQEKATHSTRATPLVKSNIFYGRPSLRTLIPSLIHAPRTYILGCGPEGLKIDLSNAVAAAQSRVLKREVQEVALHTETFGW